MGDTLFQAVDSPYLVPFDGAFKVRGAPTTPAKNQRDKKKNKEALARHVEKLDELQALLYAHDQHSVLLVFQALDAAGKDSTIRAVLTGINPAGCEIYAFKRPSDAELDHDFLWRTSLCLPQRGRIGVFNRSYYEEVLAVRVHPEYLKYQKLPRIPKRLGALWQERCESIRDYEKHLARNGTVILKFWLNVSREEQRQRFLARLEQPEKNWKFEAADVGERAHWKQYQKTFEDALNETSRPWAPWYAIPADSKSWMRATVAELVVRSLKTLKLRYPKLEDAERAKFGQLKAQLERER